MGHALPPPGLREEGMIVVAIGIIGATVMPHNLYLHSALVHSRQVGRPRSRLIRRAIGSTRSTRWWPCRWPSSSTRPSWCWRRWCFHGKEQRARLPDGEVGYDASDTQDTDWIRVAYLTLAPLLGTALASMLFAVALLASGQSSTITGTLAGQVVMEGFMHWRVRPWVRRLLTRPLAILPAVLIIGWRGDSSVTDLLVLSQVVLALQLPLAMFPLLHFTSSQKCMGQVRQRLVLLIAGWATCLLITVLDL